MQHRILYLANISFKSEAKRKHFILIIQRNKCRYHKRKKKSKNSAINSITDRHTNYEIESTELLWSKQFHFAP